MTAEELRAVIFDALRRIAPEMDPASIKTGSSLRDQVDVDSMDFLNFIVALHDRLGIEIPEVDYATLRSVDAMVAYLSGKLGQGSAGRTAPAGTH
jgi:acyl carrier protein